MQITLKDIARIVGVAESTVSRALNDKPGVGEKTRKKILKIAEKNNYRPNQLARGLAANKTNMIAVILSDMNSSANIEIVKSIEKEAEKNNYQIILCNTNQQEVKEKSYLSLLESKQVDGAIIIGGKLVSSHLLKASFSRDNKIVLVNRLSEEIFFPSVLTDSSQGTYKAVKHLVKEGFKKIALISSNQNDLFEEEKINGYQSALQSFNFKAKNQLVFNTDKTRSGGYNAFLEIINSNFTPDAFITTNELITVGLVEAIKTGGFFIPADFAVVGYGDNILTEIVEPSLTVISEPTKVLGKISFNFLLELFQDKLEKEQIKVLSPKLIIRESSISKYI